MTVDEYFAALHASWRGELVVCSLGTTGDRWWTTTRSHESFYVNAAMGFAASFALGLALACPDQRVLMLDSDGALAMNLGGLLTEAATQPANLVHVVLNNRSYGCLNSAPLVNAERTDYAGVARATGIANVHSVSSAAELTEALRGSATNHAFIVAEVEKEAERSGFEPPLPLPFDGPEAKYTFGRHLESRLGRPVFGPSGY
jgi:thiamine pyrophosphate-dependent acetolactate synthase large subunit-like protein